MAKGSLLTRDVAVVGDLKTVKAGSGQVVKQLVGTVARTNTTAVTLGQIAAGATITSVRFAGATGSNAGTSATISAGYSGGTGTELLSTVSVLGAAGVGQYMPSASTASGTTLTQLQTVTGIYAESGTASTTGGPWTVVVEYVENL